MRQAIQDNSFLGKVLPSGSGTIRAKHAGLPIADLSIKDSLICLHFLTLFFVLKLLGIFRLQ